MAGTIAPADSQERTKNPLRPNTFAEVVGQDDAKYLMTRAIEAAWRRVTPLEHTLLVAQSGTGKSTFSHVIGNELGVDVYDLEAPVSIETLMELRETMQDGDILKIEEIHQQGIMERRGKSGGTSPEALYALMEDRVIPTQEGMLPYPAITIVGTTTDEGMLPDAFINRFPLRPRLTEYTREQLGQIVRYNAVKLGLEIEDKAVDLFAGASRGVPREVNNLMRNAAILGQVDGQVSEHDAREVLRLCIVTEDGLNIDMQGMLTFLYTRCRRETGDGSVTYQASVNTIATALGKSRDAKAIALRVEPWLIKLGFLQVGHGGRLLTDAGIQRARELLA